MVQRVKPWTRWGQQFPLSATMSGAGVVTEEEVVIASWNLPATLTVWHDGVIGLRQYVQGDTGSEWTISVSGLPAGVTYDSGTESLVGASSGEASSTATFTLTRAGFDPVVATATVAISDTQYHDITGLPLTSDGWTDLDAMITSDGYSDARILYVSSSDGNDSTGQIYSQAQVNALGGTPTNPAGAVDAYATIGAAWNQMRAGYPDVMLLKRGDVWQTGLASNLAQRRGRSKTERTIFAAYGVSGPLPNVRGRIASSSGGGGAGPLNYTIIANIDNYNPINDPAAPEFTGTKADGGINSVRYGTDNLVEGVRFALSGVGWQSADSEGMTANIAFRRNIFTENWPASGHAQGIYMDRTDGVLIEENIFWHSGWINREEFSTDPTMYNHGMYLQYNTADPLKVLVRNNIVADSSSYSIMGRTGGVFHNNLSLRDPIGIGMWHKGGELSFNVTLDSQTRGPGQGGHGWGMRDQSSGITLVEYNIVANKEPGTGQSAWALSVNSYNTNDSNQARLAGYDPPKIGVYRGNVFYHWYGTGFNVSESGGNSPVGSLTFENNKVIAHPQDDSNWLFEISHFADEVSLSGNHYYSPRAEPFRRLGLSMNFSQWITATGETDASSGPISFPEPGRNIETYMSSIGLSGGVDEFLAAATAMHRWNWDDRFTAAPVNSYIRAGFGVPDPS